jgi:predicted XRE-type DNA-binding protein
VIPWAVRYYRDPRGRLPVADFFALPSVIGVTKVEHVKFRARLELVREHGLGLIACDSDVLEPLKGETYLVGRRRPLSTLSRLPSEVHAMNDRQRDLDPGVVRPGDAVDHLERLLGNDPEVALLLAQERLRVRVTDGMRRARQLRGLSQADLAERMGITQGRVSRIESVHHDRRLDSLAAHLHAVGAELLMAFKVGDQLIQVERPAGTQVVPTEDGVALRDDDVAVAVR